MSVANRIAVGAKSLHNTLYRRFDKGFLRTIKGMPILLLTVAGRSSGKEYTTPVCYLRDGDAYVVIGSAGGAPDEPQWFRNLRRASTARIEVGDGTIEVEVAVVKGAERERLWAALVAKAPFFDGYQRKIDGKGGSRQIPLASLTPRA